jgi:predicted regulator of Ras-like GTPase activity (Roadblock/LC7/MglB family)
MSLPGLLDGRPEVKGAVLADHQGHVFEVRSGTTGAPEELAATSASALSALAIAGSTSGLARLEKVVVRGTRTATIATLRPDAFLLVDVDAQRRTVELEKALEAWSHPGGEGSASGDPPGSAEVQGSGEPTAAAPAQAPAHAPQAREPATELTTPPHATATMPAVAGQSRPATGSGPWAALRRSLVRGHLTEASAWQQAIAAAPPAAAPPPGGEYLPAEELGEAMQRLLGGVGSVLAGDTVGGLRSLGELTGPAQANLSIRWLSLYWSARAALGGSTLEAVRQHVKDALELSRQLDVEARAVSQLAAGELLTRAGEHDKALIWLSEARSRFERVTDRWGIGHTWLVEARLQAATGNDEGCVAAAQRAAEANPTWDGPPIFLAGRALQRGDLAGADGVIAEVRSPAADRVRKLLDAVRQQVVSQEDAAEFLKLHHAPPTAQTIRALERIANASPQFFQAREAMAWMLLKLGRYGNAQNIFSWLLAQPLTGDDRANVLLGLSCIASATRVDASAETGDGRAPGRLADSALMPRVAQPGVNGQDAVLSGRLSSFSLPDLVEFLRSARRTGTLVISGTGGMGTMRFDQGWISGAASPATPRLGELLVRSGKITSEALAAATPPPAAEAGPVDVPIGEQLIRQGVVDEASVAAAVRQQIELTLRELIQWSDGEFAFNRESENEPVSRLGVRVDAQELLLILFKEQDEASRNEHSSEAQS